MPILNTTEEDKEDKQEVTACLADAEEISVAAALVAITIIYYYQYTISILSVTNNSTTSTFLGGQRVFTLLLDALSTVCLTNTVHRVPS